MGLGGAGPLSFCLAPSFATLRWTLNGACGFSKDLFIFSDARANGFIDSSCHWGHTRCLLFSHWLHPTALSTFLAGAQGDLRGTKLIALRAQLEKGSHTLGVCSPSGWGAEEPFAELRRRLAQEQQPGQLGFDSV